VLRLADLLGELLRRNNSRSLSKNKKKTKQKKKKKGTKERWKGVNNGGFVKRFWKHLIFFFLK